MFEPKPDPRLIAIDMDGTLMNSAGQVSARNRAALQLAEAAGVEIVIATGRRHGYAMGVLHELGLPLSNVLVTSNGTVIRTVGAELIQRTHMPRRTALWLCNHLNAFRSSLVFTFDNVGPSGEEQQGSLVVERTHTLHGSIGRWMQANAPFIRSVSHLEDALQGDMPPIQAMLSGPGELIRAAEARLLEHPGVIAVGAEATDEPSAELVLHRTAYPDRDLTILDILPAGCSKASALAHLAQLRGFLPADVLALGDNWNDLPMFEFAGRCVLMANAPGELRDLARLRGWTVGLSNDEDGVAVAIEQALGREPDALDSHSAPLASSVRW